MDVRQLRYFVTVLDAKSLSKASELLHIAQPALGLQIRNLERELGAKLLHRRPRGVEPTAAGERLAQHAGRLLQEFDRVRQDLIGYVTGPTGSVSLCIGRALPRIVTATIVERCRNTLPDVQLRLVMGERDQLKGKSKDAEIDLELTFHPRDDDHSASEPLVQDELLLVYSAKVRPSPKEIDFRNLTDRTLILPSKSHNIRRLVESAARQAGRKLKIYCDVDSLHTTTELVKRGVADTLLPLGWVCSEVNEGIFRTAKIVGPKLQRTLYMVSSFRQSRSAAVDLVRRETSAIIFDFARDQSFGWNTVSDDKPTSPSSKLSPARVVMA